jgi:hypothetical protein
MSVIDSIMKQNKPLFEQFFLQSNKLTILKPEYVQDALSTIPKKTGRFIKTKSIGFRARQKAIRDNRSSDRNKQEVQGEIKVRIRAEDNKLIDDTDILRIANTDYSISSPYDAREENAVFVELSLLKLDNLKETI